MELNGSNRPNLEIIRIQVAEDRAKRRRDAVVNARRPLAELKQLVREKFASQVSGHAPLKKAWRKIHKGARGGGSGGSGGSGKGSGGGSLAGNGNNPLGGVQGDGSNGHGGARAKRAAAAAAGGAAEETADVLTYDEFCEAVGDLGLADAEIHDLCVRCSLLAAR